MDYYLQKRMNIIISAVPFKLFLRNLAPVGASVYCDIHKIKKNYHEP